MRNDIRRRRPASPAVPAATPPPRASAAAHPSVPSAINLLEPVPAATTSPVSEPVSPPPVSQPAPVSVAAPLSRRRVRQASLTAVTLIALFGIGLRAQADTGRTKQATENDVQTATAALQEAKDDLTAGNFAEAERRFAVAQQSLHRADLRLSKRGQLGGPLPPLATGQIAAGRDLVAGGERLADSGRQLAGELSRVQSAVTTTRDPYQAGKVLAERSKPINQTLSEAAERLERFGEAAAAAQASGGFTEPAEQAAALEQLTTALPGLQSKLGDVRQAAAALPELLGVDRFKQYLVLFQNPAELRATGGFIGTYGQATVDGGVLKELKVDSIYNPANQANQATKETAPPPYQRFAEPGKPPIYAMQNANYSPDFPSTAERFQANYEQAGRATTDGVIGLTTLPIIEILKITGPLELPEYGYTLTAENFQTLLQDDQRGKAEVGDTDPKKILRDFAPKLAAQIAVAPAEQQKRIGEVIAKAVASRDLTVNLTDDRLQRLVDRAGLSGRLSNSANALTVIDDNVAGFKSSLDITTAYRHQLTVGADGTVTGTLTVTRRHSGATSPDANQNFTRLFLPKGSTLKNVSNLMEGTAPLNREEDGHTVIGAWTDVAPLAERTTVFTYVLPERADLEHGRLPVGYFKQAGRRADYQLNVSLPAGYRWTPRAGVTGDGRTLSVADPLGNDYTDVLTFREN